VSLDPTRPSPDFKASPKPLESTLSVPLKFQGIDHPCEVTLQRGENDQLVLVVKDRTIVPGNRFKQNPLKIYLTEKTQTNIEKLSAEDREKALSDIVQHAVDTYIAHKIQYRGSDTLFKMTDSQIIILVPKDNKFYSWLQRAFRNLFGLTPGPGYREVVQKLFGPLQPETDLSAKVTTTSDKPSPPVLTVDIETVQRLGLPKHFKLNKLNDSDSIKNTLKDIHQSLSYLKSNGISVASPALNINENQRKELLGKIFSFIDKAKEQNIDSFSVGSEEVTLNELMRLIGDEPDLLNSIHSDPKLSDQYEQLKPKERLELIHEEIQTTETNYQALLSQFLNDSFPLSEQEAANLGRAFDPDSPPSVNVFRKLEANGIIPKNLADQAESAYRLAQEESISFSRSFTAEGFTKALETLELKGLAGLAPIHDQLRKSVEEQKEQLPKGLNPNELENFFIAPLQRGVRYSLLGKELAANLQEKDPDEAQKLSEALDVFKLKIAEINEASKSDEEIFCHALAKALNVAPPRSVVMMENWMEEHKEALENLETLDLRDVSLKTLPTAIQKLTQLKELKLHGESLTELPKELSQLSKLKWIDLSGYKNIVSDPVIGTWAARISSIRIDVEDPLIETELKKMGLNAFRPETIYVPGKDNEGYNYRTST